MLNVMGISSIASGVKVRSGTGGFQVDFSTTYTVLKPVYVESHIDIITGGLSSNLVVELATSGRIL